MAKGRPIRQGGGSRDGDWYCKHCYDASKKVKQHEFVRIRHKRICVKCGKTNDKN